MAHSRNSSLLTAAELLQRNLEGIERARRGKSTFMWSELETGRHFAELARTSKHPSAIARRRQNARKAYDTLQHYLSRPAYLPESELKDFHEELRVFSGNSHSLEKSSPHSWRNIAFTLIDTQKGEWKAQTCVNAWWCQLALASGLP